MFVRMGKKQYISVELNDFVFRLLYKSSAEDNSFQVNEIALTEGLIEHGEIVNEMGLFDLLKITLEEWDMRKRPVRFFVSEQSVLMRPIDLPKGLPMDELRGYLQMEIGNSIHLPFDNPLFDIHDADPNDDKVVLFAAPDETVRRFSALYDDATLIPEVAEVRMLANGRFLQKADLFSSGKSYLIADWSIDGLSVGIFTDNEIEFLRYQEIESLFNQWKEINNKELKVKFSFIGDPIDYRNQLIDQVMEIGRISNFYRFSLHKGDRSIDQIILMGDNPEMNFIHEQTIRDQEQKVIVIDDEFMQKFYPDLNGRHAALVGLAIRGGE